MFTLEGQLVTSASDLAAAVACEFAFLRALDVKRGRLADPGFASDPFLDRAAGLGDRHEQRWLAHYRESFGDGVAEIGRPRPFTPEALAQAAAETEAAFTSGADAVFQSTFFDTSGPVAFLGFADFIVRGADGRYRMQDAKLARSAKVTALLQLAAYAERLGALGVPIDPEVDLILGDNSVSRHRLADITPVYRIQQHRLLEIIAERDGEGGVVAWGDLRYAVCGHCPWCEAEAAAADDLLLVANMRMTQRSRLHDAGIETSQGLATSSGPIEGIAGQTLDTLRRQALLQTQATGDVLPVEVFNAAALAHLPPPSPGDIFFDFEGDPLYTEGDGTRWNLDYLFGWVDAASDFTALWAHSFAEEREALRSFLEHVAAKRADHPDMHIYHYAAYERTHLLSLAARHGIGEEEIDDLLRSHALVDLYPIVRKAIRVGAPSYSIKKLEPLYMGEHLRTGVTNAADSVVEYAEACRLRDNDEPEAAAAKLEDIADYNRYDCVSTLRLRDWLVDRAKEADVASSAAAISEEALAEPTEERPYSVVAAKLLGYAGDPLDPDRTADQTAVALAIAALEFHWREKKTFWHSHFARLIDPKDDWVDTRDVFDISSVEITDDWHLPTDRAKLLRRHLRLTGTPAPGSHFAVGSPSKPYLMYEFPGPVLDPRADPGARSAIQVMDVLAVGDDWLEVSEPLRGEQSDYLAPPTALSPGQPPPTGGIAAAITDWAGMVAEALPTWPGDPVADLLRRNPPRLKPGSTLAPIGDDPVAVVSDAVAALVDSYLAVQGPPGTGKTYVGAHVIARLVREHQWKVGVVGQSHAVVENLLTAVVRKAGLDASLVGKAARGGNTASAGEAPPFTVIAKDSQAGFAASRDDSGYVLGGTTWDFTNRKRFSPKQLDLLVIDEAGQFSLANTIAAASAARNLLLLGDPQQLPQVSQGTHPEPVDTSALGWIAQGSDVLPATRGYFLPESWRMHPAVAEPVSHLSYEGKLRSHLSASERNLEGVEPGLVAVPVWHEGNSTSSEEEALVVVELVTSVLGKQWTDPHRDRVGDPLGEGDVIVVTPYNAQLATVRRALDDAGFGGVRVGTVDKFQGQEAVVSIVTLAASSAAEVPRGMEFLIMRNRLNVAISRAQWAARLVYSPDLSRHLPGTPQRLAELSAFVTLTEPSDGSTPPPLS